MNDKEKLISFINKGKENKPVKEVHVIKDSPTEAHILLVNEDGTNVASNRFEIMDAHDLMTLIENPSDSGLIIDISEDNKKVSIKISENTQMVYIPFDELIVEQDERWPNLFGLINYLNSLGNGDTQFYLRKYKINLDDTTKNEITGRFQMEFDKLFWYFPYIITEGYIDAHSFLFKFLLDSEENSITPMIWQDTSSNYFTGTSYALLLGEYEAYKSVNGPLYINLYF